MREEQLAGLIAFVTVVQKHSFSSAAETLGVTASAVSQAMKQLEQRVGVRLLHRTTRQVGLTEAGERFFERVRPALSEIVAAVDDIGELQNSPSGTIRLSIPQIASRLVIEPILSQFMKHYPNIQLEIAVSDAASDIIASGYDVGIRLKENLDKEVIGARVGDDLSLAVVGAPSYFAAHGKPSHPRDLYQHECILFRQMPGGSIYKWEFDENGEGIEIAVAGRLTVNDSALLTRSAINGLGLAQVIAESVRDELNSGKLIRVLAQYCSPFPGFHIYYPSRTHLPSKIRVFVDFLRSYSRDERQNPKQRPSRNL